MASMFIPTLITHHLSAAPEQLEDNSARNENIDEESRPTDKLVITVV
jgi:hypothetical protein